MRICDIMIKKILPKRRSIMGKKRDRIKRALQDKPPADQKHYSKKIAATVLSVFSVLSVVLAVVLYFVLKHEFSDTDAFQRLVAEHYVISAILLVLVCALQVVVALIPGELVEIVSGYAFGAVPGTLLCLTGILLGSVTVLLLIRKFGRRFLESLVSREKIDSLPILNDPKKRNLLTFLLFLIPGTPKDLITYVIGVTNMSIPMYLLLTSVARLPSILSSAVGGDALGANQLSLALTVLAITGVVSLLGYVIYTKFFHKKKENTASEKKESDPS